VVSGIELAGDGALESGHGCLQHRQSGVSGGTFNAGEGILAGLEAFESTPSGSPFCTWFRTTAVPVDSQSTNQRALLMATVI